MIHGILLTQYNGAILGPIAKVLGVLLDLIFNFLDMIGIPNIGLAIILFTIIIMVALLPLTIKQQKFSKLSAKMNPELQAIQAKYKGKKDQDSLTQQNEETQAVYKKYGVSPTGSCLQLIIQMPILFALYRVIYSVPAYVTKVYNCLNPLASEILATKGGSAFVGAMKTATTNFKNKDFTDTKVIIDVLNRASTDEWSSIITKFPNLSTFDNAQNLFHRYNNFLGLNISDSPQFIIINAFQNKSWLILLGALMIPVLSALTQWINTLFMPQPQTTDDSNPMAASMKSMNVVMPIMSAFFCLTLPCGMGIYWIASAVVRSIEQVFVNRHIDHMNIDKLVEKNTKKYNEKLAKAGITGKNISSKAAVSTKNVGTSRPVKSQKEKDEALAEATAYYSKNAKPGSLAAKANMVKQYNEKNSSNKNTK